MTDKQYSNPTTNVAGLCNKWIIEALQRDDFVHVKDKVFLRLKSIGGLTLIAELKARWVLNYLIKEPPNSATDVVEPEEPLCYLQEIDTLGGAYEQVAWGEGFPVYTAPQNMEAEIKRLQEREWVDLTVEELTNIRDFYVDDSGHVDLPETFARAVESKLKEMNNA